MPKAKLFAKGGPDKKRGKLASKAQPSTADEYLEAGVDFEEAGEKWRGGDAAKSTRFFVRAIDCYQEALGKFPASFDLAYNKARVQYELTQYSKLPAQLPGTLIELLETALTSSRYALNLKQDNAEALYTTAQILSSLAESSNPTSNSPHQQLPLLEESLTLFQQCLAIQENLYLQTQSQPLPSTDDPIVSANNTPSDFDVDNEDGGASLSSTPPANAVQEEQWASILEPITPSTLLDTVVAQLEVLTLVCPLITDATLLSFIETYSAPLLTQKVPTLLPSVDQESTLTATITQATFVSAFTDASFQQGQLTSSAYLENLAKTWSSVPELSTSPEALVTSAESYITFNTSTRNSPESASALSARWKALSTSQTNLTTASKIPNVDKLPKIYLLRGDVDLSRYQLGNEGFEAAAKSGKVLVGNAEKFYRGAKGLGAGDEAIVREAAVKEGVARALGGNIENLKVLMKEVGMEIIGGLLGECWEEGLVTEAEVRGWGF